MNNRTLLQNHCQSGDLEAQIEAFLGHYDHRCYHESLNVVTPAGAYFNRTSIIVQKRETIKRNIIENRRLQHRKLTAPDYIR